MRAFGYVIAPKVKKELCLYYVSLSDALVQGKLPQLSNLIINVT